MLVNQTNMGKINQARETISSDSSAICLWLEKIQRTFLNYAALALIYNRLGSWREVTKNCFILNKTTVQFGWCPNQTLLRNFYTYWNKCACFGSEGRSYGGQNELLSVSIQTHHWAPGGCKQQLPPAATTGRMQMKLSCDGAMAVASIFVEWTQLQKWQFAFSQAATSSRKGH